MINRWPTEMQRSRMTGGVRPQSVPRTSECDDFIGEANATVESRRRFGTQENPWVEASGFLAPSYRPSFSSGASRRRPSLRLAGVILLYPRSYSSSSLDSPLLGRASRGRGTFAPRDQGLSTSRATSPRTEANVSQGRTGQGSEFWNTR